MKRNNHPEHGAPCAPRGFNWILIAFLARIGMWKHALASVGAGTLPARVPSFQEQAGMNEGSKNLPFHFESCAKLDAPAETVFSYLDDHRRLSAHMSRRSWMMAGGRLKLEMDTLQGHALGSKIRLSGRVLGIPLEVEEIVTDYSPPLRKYWETTGTPNLLVIGRYRMGFEITPQGNASQLRIFIDYALPASLPGRMFGGWYARWCTRRMVGDVEKHLR